MKRREFLQRTGLALVAYGTSDIGLSVLSDRYYKALAEPTSRKLALLVGINQYHTVALAGCVTDVELQRELLTHRFGFNPSDILTLTDQQATREAIETAFVVHLIEQARGGDVVVFHFSGYGSQVASGTGPEAKQTSLVTVDDPLLAGEASVAYGLLEETLLLLLRSLPTDKVTTVLDTSYSYPGQALQGGLRIRARPSLSSGMPSDAEMAFQERMLSQTNLDRERLRVQRRSGQMPGVVLAAASAHQAATEAHWDELSAGLFTYGLTRQLWQATAPTTLRISLDRVRDQMVQFIAPEQLPQLTGQKGQDQSLLPYHLSPRLLGGADGVILSVEETGKTVQLWLGGLLPGLLEPYGINSLLTVTDDAAPGSGEALTPSALHLQVLTRDGLLAKAKVRSSQATSTPTPSTDTGSSPAPSLRAGQFVREWVRVLPRSVGLAVALDSTLARIERVDAISALSAIPHISVAIAGEQSADYLFSKVSNPPTQVATLPGVSGLGTASASGKSTSYGLFSLGQDVIPHTIGEGGEAIKMAVRRLVPQLQTLLAAKVLSLTTNESSSRLAVQATLELLEAEPRILQQRRTWAIARTTADVTATAPPGSPLSLAIGNSIQYRLENQGAEPIYFVVLGLNSNGQLVTLYSPTVNSNEAGVKSEENWPVIPPGGSVTLPQTSPSFQWILRSPMTVTETYLICSRAPFLRAIAAMESGLRIAGEVTALYSLTNPLEVAQAVLQDLSQASEANPAMAEVASDSLALNLNTWASFRFVYRVV